MSALDTDRTLYVSGLDDTLLRADGRISTTSAHILDELVADGLPFTVATTRSYASARRGLGDLDLQLPLIVYGGATAVDPGDDGRLWWEHFDGATVHPLMAAALAAGVTPLAFWRDGEAERISWVSGAETPGIEHFLASREGDPRLAPVDAWDQVDHDRTFFVSVIGEWTVLRRLARMIRAISWGTGCSVALQANPSAPRLAGLDVTAAAATKATGVRRVAERIGATRIVAFGDGSSDLPLFAIADESYAVAGASDEVKAAATGVLGSVDSDAVARHLAERLGRAVA